MGNPPGTAAENAAEKAAEKLERASRLVREALAEVSGTLLSDDELLDALGRFEQTGRLVDAGRVVTAAEVEKRSDRGLGAQSLAWKRGSRRGVDLIAQITRVSGREAARRVKLGQATGPRQQMGAALPPLFPAVAFALTAGDLGVDAAEAITVGLAQVAPRAKATDLEAAERALVASATGVVTEECGEVPWAGYAFSADLVRGQVQVWQARLDPDGTAPSATRDEARSNVSFGAFRGGLYPLRGGVTPDLRGIMDGLFNTYLSARAPLPGNGGTGPVFPTAAQQADLQERIDAGELIPGAAEILDHRSGAEKHADILRAILDSVARDPRTPTMGGAAPTVTVHVNATDLKTGTGTGWVDGIDASVSMRTVTQLMCAGGYENVIFSDAGNILGWSTTQRCFTAAQRKALIARDGDTCLIPDCPIPAQWCEAHHVIPWQQHQQTHIDNGVLLCWYHHHTIDTAGWTIRMIRGRPQLKAPPWIDPTSTWRPAGTHHATTPSTTSR